jgi:UDP-3-O-[3-hydroxymyristoyl] glucosamine N-acyltransferase
LDNLVQIGHNARMGRHSIIVSQAGMSGSSEIEDFVVIGGQAGVSNHVKIGKGAFIAGKSGVTRSLEGGKVYGGFPARPVEQWRKEVGVVARMAKAGKSKTEQTDND